MLVVHAQPVDHVGQEARAYDYSPQERAFVEDRLDQQAVGGPATVARRLDDLVSATAADELMVTTMVHDPADRLRSFRLLADLRLPGVAAVA